MKIVNGSVLMRLTSSSSAGQRYVFPYLAADQQGRASRGRAFFMGAAGAVVVGVAVPSLLGAKNTVLVVSLAAASYCSWALVTQFVSKINRPRVIAVAVLSAVLVVYVFLVFAATAEMTPLRPAQPPLLRKSAKPAVSNDLDGASASESRFAEEARFAPPSELFRSKEGKQRGDLFGAGAATESAAAAEAEKTAAAAGMESRQFSSFLRRWFVPQSALQSWAERNDSGLFMPAVLGSMMSRSPERASSFATPFTPPR